MTTSGGSKGTKTHLEVGGQLMDIHCLQESNYFSGMSSSHRRLCYSCDETATHHLDVGYFCGNVCKDHATEAQRTYGSRVDIEERLRGLEDESQEIKSNDKTK